MTLVGAPSAPIPAVAVHRSRAATVLVPLGTIVAMVAGGTIVLGVVGWFAFEPLFELFHRVFFPGGNWAFDARSSRLVQLYPYAFWQLAATGLGTGVAVLGILAWAVGRRRARAPGN